MNKRPATLILGFSILEWIECILGALERNDD